MMTHLTQLNVLIITRWGLLELERCGCTHRAVWAKIASDWRKCKSSTKKQSWMMTRHDSGTTVHERQHEHEPRSTMGRCREMEMGSFGNQYTAPQCPERNG